MLHEWLCSCIIQYMSITTIKQRFQFFYNILSALLILFLIYQVAVLTNRMDSRIEPRVVGSAIEVQFSKYNYSRLAFCYERDIKPCNDDVLIDWNEAHPKDTFKVESSQQIGEKAKY